MLRTFGGLEVEGNDLRRPKPLLLLAYLTLHGPQLRGHLAELFWPNNPQANRSLTTTLGRLKTALPGRVLADEARAWSALSSDVHQLRRDLADGDLESALALYRGPFLEGLNLRQWSAELEEWLYQEREAIAEELRSALLARAELEAGRGRLESAAAWAERAAVLPGAATLEPATLTRLHAILCAAGHPLATRLEPEAAGYGLSLPDSARAARAALETLSLAATPHNLPALGGQFVGREVELAELRRVLDAPDPRLLTLVGQGGTGKTRLALQAARESLDAGLDGVHFVSLEAAEDLSDATAAIAAALGLKAAAGSDPLTELTQALGARRQLLVLDNLEQLVGGARLVTALLERCENLKLLVTSRERLDLSAEWVVSIDGLSYPPTDLPAVEVRLFDAVQLFALRARQASAVDELSDDDLRHVVRLCRLLQGAPLGLELAASLTRALPCSEIADEVERSFDSLARRSPGENERHQSLRSAFEHSWRLLSPAERLMLGRLSVFRGGFTRAAATQVAQGSAATLLSLVDRSLVYLAAADRLALHPVSRQYAHERLLEDAADHRAACERHALCFLELATAAEPRLKGPEQVHWLASLTLERDNLRAALDWAVERRQVELGLRLATALQQFWWLRGPYQEGYAYLTALLELPQAAEHPRLRGKALHRAGTLCQELGDLAQARLHYRAAQALAEEQGDEQLLADALHSRALLALKLGEREESSGYYARCLALQRRIGDRWGVSVTLNNMAHNELDAGNRLRARELILEALALKEELGDVQGIAYALNNLGTVSLQLGEASAAKAYVERSLALKRQLDDRGGVATSLANLARIARDQGRYGDAHELLIEALRALESLGNGWTLAAVLGDLARLEARAGRAERALRLAGGVEALSAALAAGGLVIPAELEDVTRQATAQVGSQVAARLLREGGSLSVGTLIDWACDGAARVNEAAGA